MFKKLIILLSILLLTPLAFAEELPSRTYTSVTDNVIILRHAGTFFGAIVRTDGTNPLTLDIYDENRPPLMKIDGEEPNLGYWSNYWTPLSGPKVIPSGTVITTSGFDRAQIITPPNGPVALTRGLVYLVGCASGTSCWDKYSITIYYSPYAGQNRYPYK